MKNIVMQKTILKAILLSAGVFVVLLANSFLSSLLPPLIKKVYIEEDFGAYYQITLQGRFASTKHKKHQIIVNNESIPESDILTWSDDTISYITSNTTNNLDTIQIKTQQTLSNKKFLLKNIPSDNTSMLLEGETQYIENYIIPKLQTPPPLLPHIPIVFNTTADVQRAFFISQKQEGVQNKGLMSNKKRANIPLYMTYYDGEKVSLFPNESLWFHQISKASIDIEEGNRVYSYDISLQNLFENLSYISYAYTLDIEILQSATDQWVFIPYSTTYQYTAFSDTMFAMQHKNFTNSIYSLGNTQHISIKTNVLVGNNNLKNTTPVLYDKERSLSYLFYNIPEDTTSKNGSQNGNTAIQSMLKTEIGKKIDDIDITHMKLPASFNSAQVKNIYTIQSGLTPSIPATIDVEVLNSFLKKYIFALYQIGKEQSLETLVQLDYIRPLLQYESFQKNTNTEIYQHLIAALLMRTNNIVARTIIGIDVTHTLSQIAKKEVVQYISWVEIFTKEHGWVQVKDEILSERNNNQIGFFIAEVFLNKIINSQNPEIPKLNNITLVNK